MKRRTTRSKPVPPERKPWSWSWLIVGATLLIVAVLFDVHGQDNFRLPKELALRASAIALLIVFGFWATRADIHLRATLRGKLSDPVVLVAMIVVAWTTLSTLTSVNRMLSVDSLITVLASAIFFFGCQAGVRTRPMMLFDVALAAAIGNAILAILQRYKVWQPFRPLPGVQEDVGAVAFLGNSNDVGNFLVFPAVAALIAAAVIKGRRRAAYAVVAAVLLGGLVASGARTAIGACVIAIVVAAFSSGGRLRVAALISAAIMSFLMVWQRTEIGRRYWTIIDAALIGKYDVAFSERLPAFLTAWEMFRDRPLVGTGPGTFKWLYMRYRMEIAEKYPAAWTEGWPLNFAEVHNDHLQVAAETGAPGYALLLAALVILVVRSRRDRSAPGGKELSHLALPIAAAAFTVMLAQFPLQLAAPRAMMLFFAAFCTQEWKYRSS